MHAERTRIQEAADKVKYWKRWGPYLTERAWGNPREDYSPYGTAWEYFTHDHARSRAYRWTEDGIAGISDNHQRLCFAFAFWNGRDPILKERLFGLGGPEGNHGEDVKEYYYYLDSTPTHSYMKCLYKYPQAEFPYSRAGRRGIAARSRPDERVRADRYGNFRRGPLFRHFDRIRQERCRRHSGARHGDQPRTVTRPTLHLLPTVWFRNTWSWGYGTPRPEMSSDSTRTRIVIAEQSLGEFKLWLEDAPPMLFTENESNTKRLWGYDNGATVHQGRVPPLPDPGRAETR